VVDTARHDWPHFYPEFFTNIIGLLRTPGMARLGLLYVHTVSQELGHPRSDVNAARNIQIQKLLLSHIPEVLSIILGK